MILNNDGGIAFGYEFLNVRERSSVHLKEDKPLNVQFEMNKDFGNSIMIILEPMFNAVI
ncbi:MAG: hypothetical protein J1F03_10995 [Oscillospiraceae bacterium]|nr:hypothetical protein [Oscillospiraceae bacterium]